MQIDLKEVLKDHETEHVLTCEVDFQEVSFLGSSYPLAEKKSFELRLWNEDDRKLLLTADTSIVVSMNCDRCLSKVDVPMNISIRQELPMLDGKPVNPDPEDAAAFLDDGMLDLDQMVLDEMYLEWPAKVLCIEDCKGLCPVCGQNLNERDCGCDREVLDPRMARFQDVFNQMKEV